MDLPEELKRKPTKRSQPFLDGVARLREWWVTLLVIAFLLVLMWVERGQIWDILAFIADRQAFSAYIKGFGLLGPLVLALFTVLQVLVAVLPGYAVIIAAGYIYGLPAGYAFNLLMTVGASQLAFAIARRFGRPVVDRLAPAEAIDRWDDAAEKYGFPFFLLSFLLPVFPADTMNYVAGLSAIKGRSFLLASLIGRAPSLFMMTLMGAYGIELANLGLPAWAWVAAIGGLAAVYYLWHYLYGTSTLLPAQPGAVKDTRSPSFEPETAIGGPLPGIDEAPPAISDQFIELPQTTLHYITCGDGPPLIMVPATISTLENWTALTQFMGRRFTAYFFELPGHGQSTAFAEPFSTRQVAEAVASFADALGYDQVSLMGFSFGGMLAMRSLEVLEQRVDKICLISPAFSARALCFSRPRKFVLRTIARAFQRPTIRRSFLALISNQRFAPLITWGIRRVGRVEDSIPVREVAPQISDTTLEVLAFQFDEILGFELTPRPKPYSQPCAFAMSIYDPLIEFEATLEITEGIFDNLHVERLYFPYHQRPVPFNFQELVHYFGPWLDYFFEM